MSHPNLNFHKIDEAVFNVVLSLPQTGYKQETLMQVNTIEKNNTFSIVKPNKLDPFKKNITIICRTDICDIK